MPEQIELFDIDNPCIGVCQSNNKGYCFGCLRSRIERQHWYQMTNSQKRDVLRLIAARKRRLEQMRRKQREQLGLEFDSVVENGELF